MYAMDDCHFGYQQNFLQQNIDRNEILMGNKFGYIENVCFWQSQVVGGYVALKPIYTIRV